MATAIYRRYRPESFSELIGQSQVTDPLMNALKTHRINHAYLFSGPRGCGKTTSARILARSLNCVEGPTPEPCGVCPSCVELGRDGGGSLDVVEIDAASNNSVEDARDLRERAVFAPARDRYKIFILDEAHMVTPQGFNALLKIVEEPPEHVKFIFATTEPDKVIGTIRSRTHHYPFRLIPHTQMLEYVELLASKENVQAEPGVLPLVVRAGGGSARDTLSLLDQLIAGSEGGTISYDLAVALLGYTHAALLNDVIDALAAGNAAEAFAAVEQVIGTGQDPRRFVDDLLERFRDLILVAASGGEVSAVLGLSDAEQGVLVSQSQQLGAVKLSRYADLTLEALNELTGATSPKLQLELLMARLLTAQTAQTAQAAAGSVQAAPAPAQHRPAQAPPQAPTPPRPDAAQPAAQGTSAQSAVPPQQTAPAAPPHADEDSPSAAAAQPAIAGEFSLDTVRQHWQVVLDQLKEVKMSSWLAVSSAVPLAVEDDILTLGFPSSRDTERFKTIGLDTPAEHLRQSILQVLGVRVRYKAFHVPIGTHPGAAAPSAPPSRAPGVPGEAAQAPASQASQQQAEDPQSPEHELVRESSSEPGAQPDSAQRPEPAESPQEQAQIPAPSASPAPQAGSETATKEPVSEKTAPQNSASQEPAATQAPSKPRQQSEPSSPAVQGAALSDRLQQSLPEREVRGEPIIREVLGGIPLEES